MRSDKPIAPDPSGPSPSAWSAAAPPAVEMKMQPEEFANLRAQAAAIAHQDVHLGRFLTDLLGHLGHAHGLDAAQEDARLAAQARADARAEEDADVKVAADERAKARTAEDSQPHTPDEQAALTAARAAEDAKIKADADALAKARAEEDAATKDAGSTPAKGV